jgi:hypothetical protein
MVVCMLLERLVVASSLGFLAFAACGVPSDPTEAGDEISPPEKTLEEAGFNEPGAIEGSNLFNAPRIAEGDETPRHYASDNGGMPARADWAAGGAVKMPKARERSQLLLPTPPSPLLEQPKSQRLEPPESQALGPVRVHVMAYDPDTGTTECRSH